MEIQLPSLRERKDDIVPIAQQIQLGNAYPMQAEALAICELVGQKDRKLLNEHYKRQQKNLIKRLFNLESKIFLKNGFAVLTIDQRGIGETDGYVPGIEQDYNNFINNYWAFFIFN